MNICSSGYSLGNLFLALESAKGSVVSIDISVVDFTTTRLQLAINDNVACLSTLCLSLLS
jgi:hypothetical protein